MTAAPGLNLNVEALLIPISEKAPAGDSLRYEGTYDRIVEARREDDPALEQGVWKRDLKKADWNLVQQICLESLRVRSKDLQISAWLLEALIHLHGFPGVRVGCEIMVELCRAFWDSMYPPLSDPGYRLAPIHWMNEKLLTQLKFIPITSPEMPEDSFPHCLADWEMALRVEQSKQAPQLKKDPKTITLEMIRQGAYVTPSAFFDAAIEDVRASYAACTDLEEIFDKAFGKDSCSLGQFRRVLESILSVLLGFRGSNEAGESDGFENGHAQEYALEPVIAQEPVAMQLLPPIRSRAEAYRRLTDAADYLIRMEPHSPAPYLIRRAISWGGMSLEELLPELMANDATLKDLEKLLGIDMVVRNKQSRSK
jgi:type VI secretion system ImpA family protein